MMEQNKIELAVRKRIKMQKNSDRLLKVFIAVFILGNIFFFTSLITFPKVYRNIEPTPVGTALELGEQTVTFDSWGYSRSDRMFEILVEVENLSLEGEPNISFSCKCGKDVLHVDTERIIDNSLYVLHVKKVPRRFATASLTISTVDEEGSQYSDKFFITDKTTSKVSAASSDKEYTVYAAESKIKGYKKQIRVLKKRQEELNGKISNSVTMIDDLEAKKKLQTEAEQQETEANISRIASEAEKLQAEIEDTTLQIQELEAKIKIQKKIVRGGDEA